MGRNKLQMRFFLPEVTLGISFEDLLGINCREITEKDRRGRWAAWLILAREDKQGGAKYWRDKSECFGCKSLRGSWCKLQALPCTVNPIVTFKTGMIGMACMGVGHNI